MGLVLFLFPFQGEIQAQQNRSTVSVEEVRRITSRAVHKSAQRQDLLIDPRITEQIYANSILYVANFCLDPKENCAGLFSDDSSLDTVVDEYLKDMVALPSGKIRSLADRLAGGRMASTGWDPQVSPNAGLLQVPEKFKGSSIALRYAVEDVPLGVAGTRILMAPGPVELLITVGDKVQTYLIRIERLKTAMLPHSGEEPVNGPGGILRPASTAYCWSGGQPPYIGPFALFNHGRMTIAESDASRNANEADFVHQAVIPISVELSEGIECKKDCETALASLFAESVATWNSGCLRCDPNAMVMVTSMGTFWLDSRIVQRLGSLPANPAIRLGLDQPEEGENADTPGSPLGGSGPRIRTYLDISKDKETIQRLCQLHNEAAPWIQDVKEHLCSNRQSHQKKSLHPVVMLKKEITACGALAVACGLPLERVEINFSAYRYALPTSPGQPEIVIGQNDTGEILEMRQVIMHEVGHWFGLPHAEVGGENMFLDIMSEVYGSGEACVSAHSLRMAANAADLRWKYRIKEGGGALLGPRRNPSGR